MPIFQKQCSRLTILYIFPKKWPAQLSVWKLTIFFFSFSSAVKSEELFSLICLISKKERPLRCYCFAFYHSSVVNYYWTVLKNYLKYVGTHKISIHCVRNCISENFLLTRIMPCGLSANIRKNMWLCWDPSRIEFFTIIADITKHSE